MTVELFSAIVSAISGVLAGAGLLYAGRQFQLSRRLAKHEFMMRLFERMDMHDNLYELVTVETGPRLGWPESRKEWIEVGRLLGLYERIAYLVEDGVLTVQEADIAFSYRLTALLEVEKIRNFIYSEPDAWSGLKRFILRIQNEKSLIIPDAIISSDLS